MSDLIVTGTGGIWTDSRSYATLNDAVTAIGAAEQDLYIARQETVAALTIPANIRLKILKTGSINNTGQLIINTKNISAGNYQIFTGTGDIDFADGSVVRSSWFSNLVRAITVTSDDELTLIISERGTIDANTAVGNEVVLKWENPDNLIITSAGFTLSNISHIEAGDYQLFGGAGDFDFVDGTSLNLKWFARLRSLLAWVENERVTIIVPGSNTVDYSETTASNEFFDFESRQGTLSIIAGVTLTVASPANIIAYPTQLVKTGDGALRFTNASGWISPFWFGAAFDPGDDSTDSGEAFNEALATGCNVEVPGGVYSSTTTIVQSTNKQTVNWAGMNLRVNADVVGWRIGFEGGSAQVANCYTVGNGVIENVFGSSTRAGIQLETAGYCKVEAYKIDQFRYPLEILTSGTKNSPSNEIHITYLRTTGDTTNDKHIWIHPIGVGTSAYNNSIYEPIIYGSALYAIHIDSSLGNVNNTHIYHPTIGSAILGRAIKDSGRGTFVTGGHYETATAIGEIITLNGTYTWNASGSGTSEYYLTNANLLPNGLVLRSSSEVEESGASLTWNNTLGSLAVSEFGWGDNDNLGYNTLYVRLSDGAAPIASEVTVLDNNYIHLTADSQNCSYRIAHYLAQRITDEGEWNSLETRAQLYKDFHMSGNERSVRFRRYSAAVATNQNAPLMELEDLLSGGSSSNLALQTKIRKDESTSYHWRSLNSNDGTVNGYLDGLGDLYHSGSHTPGSVVSSIAANSTFGPDDGNVFIRSNTAGGSRNLNPSGTFLAGHWIILVESGTTDPIVFDSTGLNSGVSPGKVGLFVYDGTNWHGSQIN